MSAETRQRIREWHERAYSELSRTEPVTLTVLGVRLTVPPEVFAPPRMEPLFERAVRDEVRPEDRVLDMGTGSGVDAILAAAKSTDVVAVDINPAAIKCARANAKATGLAERIQFFESDVFDRVEGRFDLIIFNPPFRWFAPRDMLEAAITDQDYRVLTRFMAEANSYLAEKGRILLSFGTSGDLDYLLTLVNRHAFDSQTIAEHTVLRDDWAVHYYVFRLTSREAP